MLGTSGYGGSTQNVAIGTNTMKNILNGNVSNNCIIGSLAGSNMTDGSNNTGIGYNSFGNMVTGIANTGVGYNSLGNTTNAGNTTFANFNTAIEIGRAHV